MDNSIDAEIVMIYSLVDDILKAHNHYENPQCLMTDAEVCTTAIVAMFYFGGNFELARKLLCTPNYIPNMLSKSRFNRRLHRLGPVFNEIFYCLSHIWKDLNENSIYVIDSFPVCDNIRISRANIYKDEEFRGYNASKRRYFYGLKVHLLVTQDGEPVEFFLTPGAFSDTKSLENYIFDLPEGSTIYGDKAYNYYEIEDFLKEIDGINLQPIRKKNTKRPLKPWDEFTQKLYRKMIETTNSLITKLFPKKIHAVTTKGFEIKVFLFILAHSFQRAI